MTSGFFFSGLFDRQDRVLGTDRDTNRAARAGIRIDDINTGAEKNARRRTDRDTSITFRAGSRDVVSTHLGAFQTVFVIPRTSV